MEKYLLKFFFENLSMLLRHVCFAKNTEYQQEFKNYSRVITDSAKTQTNQTSGFTRLFSNNVEVLFLIVATMRIGNKAAKEKCSNMVSGRQNCVRFGRSRNRIQESRPKAEKITAVLTILQHNQDI